MENLEQIEEIFKYKKHLNISLGVDLDNETAAKVWILKYASHWRAIRLKNSKKSVELTSQTSETATD